MAGKKRLKLLKQLLWGIVSLASELHCEQAYFAAVGSGCLLQRVYGSANKGGVLGEE